MIVVTGAAGFIGSHLCDALSKGEKPTGIDLQKCAAQNCAYKKCDVRDLPSLLKATKGASKVFHLAAQVSVQKSIEDPAEDFSTNALGTLNVLEACRKNDVPSLVYASSAAIYGTPQYSPIDEAHPLSPLSPYGNSKLAGEKLCSLYSSLYGLKTVRLRFFNVYGKGQSPTSPYSGVITKFSSRLQKSQPPLIFGSGLQTRDFVHVSDVARACVQASESKAAAGNAYNIGSGKETSILSLANLMIKLSGKKLSPSFQPPLAGEIEKSVARIDAARRDFGFEPKVQLEPGIKELV